MMKKNEKSKKKSFSEKTFEETMVLAEQGNVDAQYNLALCYMNGEGVTQNCKKALEWYTKAAKQGDSWAQTNLGYCYYYGNGVRKSYKKAVEWFTKAAEQGTHNAQYHLGECYLNGNGVEKDLNKAKEWFTKASAQGNLNAQIILLDLFDEAPIEDVSEQPIIEEPLSQELDMDVFTDFDENEDFKYFPF